LVTGAGQSDIDAFAGAFKRRLLIDDEHDRASLEALEAEDVAVEHLLRIPETVPVGGVAGGLALLLLRVASAGREQRDIFRAPTVFEEQLDFVVASAHCVLAGAGHELHRRPLPAEEAHLVIDKRLKRIRDLPRVAHIVIEDQRHQRNRRGAVPVEDALALIGEHV